MAITFNLDLRRRREEENKRRQEERQLQSLLDFVTPQTNREFISVEDQSRLQGTPGFQEFLNQPVEPLSAGQQLLKDRPALADIARQMILSGNTKGATSLLSELAKGQLEFQAEQAKQSRDLQVARGESFLNQILQRPGTNQSRLLAGFAAGGGTTDLQQAAVNLEEERKDVKAKTPMKDRKTLNATIGRDTVTLIETESGSGKFEVLKTESGEAVRGEKRPLIEIVKPPSAQERVAIAEARQTRDSIKRLGKLFDESFSGPISGRIGSILEFFGQNPDKRSRFIAATSAFRNSVIKQITGAQMSEAEAKRILKQIPDPNDQPQTWLAKYDETLKNIDFLESRRLEILEQSGLIVPGGKPTQAEENLSGNSPNTAESFLEQFFPGE